MGRRTWPATNPVAEITTMTVLAATSPTQKVSSIGMPSPAPDAPPTAAMSSACEPVSAPMPWIMPTPNAVRRP